ncbi:MAG: class I SAM-dependent methyltransferase [Byssovorax sp.]
MSPPAFDRLFASFPPARVLFEDRDLIVIDKPAGMSTHAPEPERQDDAHTRLGRYLGERGERAIYLGIHQRLDRDTSGVLLFTRRKEANRGIAEQFEGRTIDKTYLAIVAGKGLRARGKLEHRIAPDRDGRMKALSMSSKLGQPAVTRYEVLERAGDRALVELHPETGRTHQIRVQLAAEGMPIAGDPLYGGAPAPRLMLHASALGLVHPDTKKKLVVRAPVPESFSAFLRGEAASPFASVEAIEAAMREAAGLRYGLAVDQETTAFRIVNGGGDGLPGVSVDIYGDHLVVSLASEEAEAAREMVLDAAMRLGPKGVYLKVRPKHASVVVDTRRAEVAPKEAVRGESAPEELTIHELGLPYLVRLGDGLSTGIFLDQRENRRRAREMAAGLRVLNLFAYTGAFTVAAVAGGARSSLTVDVSAGALAWARKNLDAQGADPALHRTLEADALRWLAGAGAAAETFDLVFLDPPSFATTKKSRFSAESDYRSLAAAALARLAPGGRLLACTNHRGIAKIRFRRFLHEAAREAGRAVAQMKDLPDPVDFPPEPGAEAHLKSVLVTLAEDGHNARADRPRAERPHAQPGSPRSPRSPHSPRSPRPPRSPHKVRPR